MPRRDLAALVILQNKARVFDAMSGSVAALRTRLDAGDRRLFDDLGDANTQLAKFALAGPGKAPAAEYQKQLAALEEQRDALEAKISLRSSELRAQSQEVSLAAVRKAIPPEAALVEYAVYRPYNPRAETNAEGYDSPHYIAYVFRRQHEVQWKDLGPAAGVDRALADLRRALANPSRKDVRELGRSADRLVVQPLCELFGDATQLLLSPDGQLNLIPFEALVDEEGHYLLERYSIAYLTAGRDLLRMQVSRQSKNAPMIVSDPWFGEPNATQIARAGPKTNPVALRRSITSAKDLSGVYFARLAGTAEEARSIKLLFPDAAVLTGAQATKASLQRVVAPSILHIATHGFFLTGSPDGSKNSGSRRENGSKENPLLRSGLALAGANLTSGAGNNGILTALAHQQRFGAG